MVDTRSLSGISGAGIARMSGGVAGAAPIPKRVMKRQDGLVQSLESVAARLDSESVSSTQRTVLRNRFNDIQRQVNELDGIVAGEGLGARGQGEAIQATTRVAHRSGFGGGGIELRSAEEPVPNRLQPIRTRVQVARDSVAKSDDVSPPAGGGQEDRLNLVA